MTTLLTEQDWTTGICNGSELPLEPGDSLDRETFHRRYEAMPPGTRAELIDGIVYMSSPARCQGGNGTGVVSTELPLEPGDCLDRETFHRRYEAMPPGIKAELIDGEVFMPSPARNYHGEPHFEVIIWLGNYKIATPGVHGADNTTVFLSEEGEPQPDACLRIAEECGGQIRVNSEGYLVGAPELVVEVAVSSAAYDLHQKLRAYERAGVREYVALLVAEPGIAWFVRRGDRFEEVGPGADGIFRSEMFPGLWLDPVALFRLDGRRVREMLEGGIATEEHAAFVRNLAAARRPE